jgi:signal transduction histidine kinase
LGDEIFEVPNTLDDLQFVDNPLVIEAPSIRFYMGMPLTTPDGYNLVVLCEIDYVLRELSASYLELLQDLGQVVVDEMELRIALRNTFKTLDLAAKPNVLKEEFISNVTHELCIPLTSIRKSLGLVNIGVTREAPKALKEPLETVDLNTAVLLNLRNELLDL